MGERERERERKIGRETGWEREIQERERERRERESGRKKKITNTKKFMEFYLVVLQSAERSEARQVSCYNP